jgi:phage gp46-like protein
MSVMNFCFNAQLGTGDIYHAARLPGGDRIGVLIFTSLFTDARATAQQLNANQPDGGAWSDVFHAAGRGSLLWTLRRRKLRNESIGLARTFALNALAWLVNTGEVTKLDVRVERNGAHRAFITVFYTELNGVEQEFNDVLTIGDSDAV